MLYSKSKSFILITLANCLILLIFLFIFAVLMSLLRIDDGMGVVFTFTRSIKFGLIGGLLHGGLTAAVVYLFRPVKLLGFCLIALFVTALLLGFNEFIINTRLFHQVLYDETVRLNYKILQPRVDSFIFNFITLLIPSVAAGIIDKNILDKDKIKISFP